MNSALKTLVLGAVLITVSLLILFVAIPLGIWVPAHLRQGALSPAAWPRVVTIALLVLGVAMLVQGLRQRLADSARAAGMHEMSIRPRHARLKTAVAMGILVVYYELVRWLGIVVASALALPALSFLYGERRMGMLVALALILPAALYAFFVYVAKIPMPLGILG